MKQSNIAIVNKATIPLGADLSAMVQALQKQVTRDFLPLWDIGCNILLLDDVTDDYDNLIIFDTADQAGALGYHDRSPKGHAYAKVFAKTTVQAKEPISTVVSHELLEMLANGNVDKLARNPLNGYLYAVEDCDAVETESYQIDGVAVSNFVTPQWFDPKAMASTKFDFLGNVHSPFKINPGGYMPVQVNGKWTQIFGSTAAFERYHRKEHSRTPIITAQEVKPFSSQTYFDPSAFPIVSW